MNAKLVVKRLRKNSRPPVLAKGQIWKLGESHLEITHLGKSLTDVFAMPIEFLLKRLTQIL